MRWLLLFSMLTLSTLAYAETYLVLQWNTKARIVLSKQTCRVPGMSGNSASLQFINNAFIRGCWAVDQNNSDHVRIDWDNPRAPGDFSVLELSKFTAVSE
jgi:hypothetical protein